MNFISRIHRTNTKLKLEPPTPDPVNLPVPSRTYLAIHATCAKVAHLSGAAECIDAFERDMEDRTTLDPNGTSANILDDAIRGLQVAGY